MGRIIAIGPGGKAQAPVRDDRYGPVIDFVRDSGQLDELLLSPPFQTREDASEAKTAMYRSCQYYCSCGVLYCTRRHANYPQGDKPGGCPRGGQRISMSAEVVYVTDPDGKRTYHVQFRLFDKREAIRALIQKYGADPNNWPYNPRAKKMKEA